MQSFDFIDLILFLGISQGVFLAITIQILKNKNRAANRVLSLILLIASLMLTGRLIYPRHYDSEWFFRIAIFVDTLIFVFGPLLYLYFRRLAFKETPNYRLHFSHFVFAIAMLFYYFWTLSYSHEEFIILGRQGKLNIIFFCIETLGILFNFFYSYRCYQLVQVYRKEERQNLSYSQNLTPFLVSFLVTVTVFVALWLLSYIMVYFLKIYTPIISYNLVWISIPVFIYVVGFYSLKQPDIFRMPLAKKEITKNKERLDRKSIQELNDKLEELMVNEKVYLDHNLTLVNLAKELNTSTNNVSWLLNNIHHNTFYDYVNKYRVQAFVEKIHKGEHHRHTLLALSMDSGFNSKSTFNKAFKMVKNVTPSNYIKQLKVS
ncbi:helix-turn-helix domain-containing protein [Aquimarina celericrescens]|uniref:Helix-turn-helix domain-containing protein n=1 Tax=Aquimarina celericrescens TaxID=1964542 RepID=A0ABW5AST0_9FLAO|nr:helix-turn-helix transcriptional regulator [Aquimarina celericrescens]